MSVDPNRPDVILFDCDPTAGMLAGMRSAEIVRACNAHEPLVDALSVLTEFVLDKFYEFDLEPCTAETADDLCPKCRSKGCIKAKIDKARGALTLAKSGET